MKQICQYLTRIAYKLKKEGFTKRQKLENFLEQKLHLKKELDAHLKKYSWIKSNYTGYTPYTLKDIQTEMVSYLTTAKKSNTHFEQNKNIKKVLINEHKFTKEIIALAKLSELFVTWQDQRKNYTLTFTTLQEKILIELAKRTRHHRELLRYATVAEIPFLFTNELTDSELKKREQGCLLMIYRGKVRAIFTGAPARNFVKKVSKHPLADTSEIKGITASLGIATGPAKIVTSAKYINKVNKGDILIATMTRPEHLPAMKKASAIVTNEGGITCHAAIVSRELGIPCIIGTTVATQMFQDGDIIEVDANKGIVKKIG